MSCKGAQGRSSHTGRPPILSGSYMMSHQYETYTGVYQIKSDQLQHPLINRYRCGVSAGKKTSVKAALMYPRSELLSSSSVLEIKVLYKSKYNAGPQVF